MSFGEHCSDFIQELIVSGVFSMRFVGYLAFYSTFRRNSYLYKYYVIPGIVPVRFASVLCPVSHVLHAFMYTSVVILICTSTMLSRALFQLGLLRFYVLFRMFYTLLCTHRSSFLFVQVLCYPGHCSSHALSTTNSRFSFAVPWWVLVGFPCSNGGLGLWANSG